MWLKRGVCTRSEAGVPSRLPSTDMELLMTVIIGVDPHNQSHTAVATAERNGKCPKSRCGGPRVSRRPSCWLSLCFFGPRRPLMPSSRMMERISFLLTIMFYSRLSAARIRSIPYVPRDLAWMSATRPMSKSRRIWRSDGTWNWLAKARPRDPGPHDWPHARSSPGCSVPRQPGTAFWAYRLLPVEQGAGAGLPHGRQFGLELLDGLAGLGQLVDLDALCVFLQFGIDEGLVLPPVEGRRRGTTLI